ncbi:MAG: helix-turn-helix domain-containing protein [Hyphomonadaceae bacterium]
MTEKEPTKLTLAFKLEALRRMEAGENVSALARDLGIKRKLLYQWRERVRTLGPAGLRSRGRPKRDVEALATQAPSIELGSSAVSPSGGAGAGAAAGSPEALALAAAEVRIAELERKIGRQELELDFFQKALRRVKDAARTNDAPAAPPSTRLSER